MPLNYLPDSPTDWPPKFDDSIFNDKPEFLESVDVQLMTHLSLDDLDGFGVAFIECDDGRRIYRRETVLRRLASVESCPNFADQP